MTHITTETRDTFTNLHDLTKARDSLPIDWGRFNDLFGIVNDSDSLEELEARTLAAIIGACTRPGMTEEGARNVGDLMAALADAEDEARDIPQGDLCALLRELQTADDLEGLELVLFKLAQHDGATYITRLKERADATDPRESNDPGRVRLEQVEALQASAKPGRTISAELAGAFVDAVQHWHILKTETPEQRATREAFREARRLLDLHGEDDPRAFAAVIKAVNLKEPGCTDRMLKECGIHLPKPTRCTADGQPLFSLEELAEALDADPTDLLDHARELEAHGLGALHINTNTHTLQ